MANQYNFGYLKEAVKAHLDLEEDELELLNINNRFHIFANEAIQHICDKKPKQIYFQFQAVDEFVPLVYDNGILRVATQTEIDWEENGIAEPNFATDDEVADWYNDSAIYLVGQVITMPDDFITFAVKKAFMWTDYYTNKVTADKQYMSYQSDSEIVVYYAGNYQIPYNAIWTTFTQDLADNTEIAMPINLLLTIPLYVASIFLQQRNLQMSQAKRQEFEIAVNRCRIPNFLENKDVSSSFV